MDPKRKIKLDDYDISITLGTGRCWEGEREGI